jgi:hypothetical protein
MPILSLNHLSALSTGADLWICPDTMNSHWSVQLDWHLNHQIRKGLAHKTQVLDAEVKGLLYENQISWHDIQAATDSLMVACSFQLPARWTLVLPWNGQLQKWVQNVFQHWKNLGQPVFRLFLPQNIKMAEFSREWQKLTDFHDITVVLD